MTGPQQATGQAPGQTAPAENVPPIKRAQDLFNAGRVSECYAIIKPMIDTPPADARDRSNIAYLQLGCALYKTGDMEAARKLNAALSTAHWRPMRYRLSLRLGDMTTAKRIRTAPDVTDRERDDFRTTAGLHLIWAKKYRLGFPLYACRHNAILFPKTVPNRCRHVPLPDDPAQDETTIVLEQGLGDVLFHLAHIRAEGQHETSRFIGLRKYGPLIRRYFPRATYLAHEDMTDAHGTPRIHLAADFVGRGFRRNWHLAPGITFDTPIRHAGEPPVWGICWRGGSGQNRREERHIPLQIFLDLLPRDARFLALQFDLTKEERTILLADGRCMIPLSDITQNPVHTIDMIRPLAGVISVDSANWHMAGLSDVPIFAIMNRTAHWFWGKESRAETAFPCATTVRKEDVGPARVGEWVRDTRKAWREREAQGHPKPAKLSRTEPRDRPVLIVGLPRSATSMTTRVLHSQGLWLGETVPGNRENPQGYFESRMIRDQLIKPTLSALGADPLGVRRLPAWDVLPPFPALRDTLFAMLRREGYDGRQPWGFKDPKLTLLWPLFARAFPQAHWVIVTRDRDKVLDSLCRTSFMARHSTSPEFWLPFCSAYDHRLNLLRASGAQVHEVDSDALSGGSLSQIKGVIRAAGLGFNARDARAALVRDGG
ncbi:sulfotransferase [Pseudooceanicola atlanticus]|uniref:sulfotransferase n=1 Tax=Pseudooceanicola atlanticus TaxID=1461694 RepID=UPI000AE49814|nr:sulfotransferase [Pseudooceanicola atlanticus]